MVCLGLALAFQATTIKDLPFVEYMAGFQSPVSRPFQLLIDSQDAFRLYWSNILGHKAQDTPTVIDFTKDELVAIHLGARPTSAFNVFVKVIHSPDPKTAEIVYIEQIPRPLAVVVKRPTSPWVLVKIPAGITNLTYKSVTQTIRYPAVLRNPPVMIGDPPPPGHGGGG